MNHIKIDPERITSDIDRNIFGGYLELGYPAVDINCGVYSPDYPGVDEDGLRHDVKKALERLKMGVIRFPGGNFASGYRWTDGVGPREQRKARHDLAWNSVVPNQFGTDEFMRLCRKLSTEAYINVNAGDGNIREAVDWIEYCNGTGNTGIANLRRKNGFDTPYKVKFWGIGNEVDGPWQIGAKTPAEFARVLTEYTKVMKWADPEIKLIAAGTSLWEDNNIHQQSRWVEYLQLMLEQAGNLVDYISIHRYANPLNQMPWENFISFSEDFDQRLTAYEGLIGAVCLERAIKHKIVIAVDEWGIMRLGSQEMMINNLEDTLIAALNFNIFIRHANSVRIANFPGMVESIGISNRVRPNKPVLLQTGYFPFELYSRTCGQFALDVFYSGETFTGTYLNRTYNGIRTLNVAATLNEPRKQIVVYIVNQSQYEVMETSISLTRGEFSRGVQVYTINGPDVKAENTDANPTLVGLRQTSFETSGKSLHFNFEPHSVTVLVCGIR